MSAVSPFRKVLAGPLLALLFLAPFHRGQAATRTWDGGGADAKWDTLLNWDSDALPANGDTLVFGSGFASGTIIDLNGNRTLQILQINTLTGFSITNSTLTLNSGDITRNDIAGTEADQIISSNIALGADGTWNIAGSGSLTLSGIISGARKGTKTGAGTLILSGANTFSGEMFLSAGTLGLGNDSAAGTGNLKIGAGTIMATGGARTISNTLTLDQDFTIGGSLPITFTANAVLARDLLITTDNTATSTFSGVISGGHKLDKAGAGTLILTRANTYSNPTTVFAGVLNIQNSDALGADKSGTTVNSGAALQMQGNIAVATTALKLNGSGIAGDGALRNVSGNNSWDGAVTLASASTIASDSGTLTMTGTVINGGFMATYTGAGNVTVGSVISGTGGLTKNDTGTLTLAGVNTYTGASTINGGTVIVNSSASLGAISAGLTINAGTLEVAAGFSTSRIITLGNAASTIQVDPSQTYTVTSAMGGTGTLNKTGAGTLTLTGTNTYTGGTTINAGTVVVNSSASLGDIAGGLTINAGTLEVSTGFSTTRAITLGNVASTIQVDPSQTYTVMTGVGGAGSLNKTGTGTMALGASNTFTGNTTVSAGTLAANADGALGSTAKVTINTGGTVLLGTTAGNNRISNTAEVALAGGTLNTGGFSETVGKMTLSGNSTFDFDAGTSHFTFDGASSLGSSTLTVLNWTGVQWTAGGTDQLLFKNSSFTAGSTTSQVQFNLGGTLYNSIFISAGASTLELVPVPEPATIFGAGVLVIALGWRERRRLGALLQKLPDRAALSRALARD